jgi:protein-tyrosine phosphatase
LSIYGEWPAYAPDEILPGLFQGGTEDDHTVGDPCPVDHYRGERRFDLVVTLYADAQPAPWGVEEMRFGFPDGNLTEHAIQRVIRMARLAHERWTAGDRVLVRCQAGVNRSGLVTALILMHDGMPADEAIDLIRRQRSPFVLSNADFEWFLRTEAAPLVHPSSIEA